MRPTESVNGLIGRRMPKNPCPSPGHQRSGTRGNLQRRKVPEPSSTSTLVHYVPVWLAGGPASAPADLHSPQACSRYGVVTFPVQGGLFVRQGGARGRGTAHPIRVCRRRIGLALANTPGSVFQEHRLAGPPQRSPTDKAQSAQGIGLRQRDAFPSGAFKAPRSRWRRGGQR